MSCFAGYSRTSWVVIEQKSGPHIEHTCGKATSKIYTRLTDPDRLRTPRFGPRKARRRS